MSKFKIGDRVKNKEKGFGTIIDMSKSIVKRFFVEYDNEIDEGHDGYFGSVRGKSGHCWWEYSNAIKKVEGDNMKETIVIYRDGKETIALLKKDNKVVRKAVAKCCPDDTYDFKVGAEIAYVRLMDAIVSYKEVFGEDTYIEQKNRYIKLLKKQLIERSKTIRGIASELAELNSELKTIQRMVDGEAKIRMSLMEENDSLKSEVETLKTHKEYYKKSCNRYLEVVKGLQTDYSKQKEINKKLVDENENLKAEIRKLKGCNREIIVGDKVEIVSRGVCYGLYREWICEYLPRFENAWNIGDLPRKGDVGVVMAKAKHGSRDKMLYAVLIDGQVYIMGEMEIKLRNS